MSEKVRVGVFDSGFGGLTVLRALLPLVPGAHYVYLGDSARLPYGSKSRETIARYAVSSARFLAAQGADILCIACNTATALALDDIRAAVSIPVVGVIEPGARAASSTLRFGTESPSHPLSAIPEKQPVILVLATQATVQSHAYREASAALQMRTVEKACPLLVPLIEEGWTDHPVTRDVLRIYLTEAFEQCSGTLAGCAPQAVLLGCTHYPLIADTIRATLLSLGVNIPVIDSAAVAAYAVAHQLGFTSDTAHMNTPATFACFATDSVQKFQRLGSHFLGCPIPEVNLVDLGG